MPRNVCLVVCFALGCALFAGCGEPLPEGLPDLCPCEITVTDGGAAFADAGLTISPLEGTWVGTARTDANGVAVPMTQGKYKGLAAGKYRVGLAKRAADSGPTDEELQNMSYDEATKAMAERTPGESLVPEHLTIAKLSPIEIEVTAGGENKITIDLGDHAEPTEEYKQQQARGTLH